MAATYSNVTWDNRSLLRLYLKDFDSGVTADSQTVSSPIWQDSELDEFLSLAGNNVYLAAADALLAEITDKARISNIIKLGSFGDNEAVVVQNMLALEKRYRLLGGVGTSTQMGLPPDTTVTLDSANRGTIQNLW